MCQFMTTVYSTDPVNEMPSPALIDLGIVSGEVNLLQVIPEMWVFGKDAGIPAGSATCQAVFQTQAARLGRTDLRAG